ncbi:hypothetical protein ERJ75_000106500 [Trypanosoma vivax]|nr:hypothetical protein ERJ75_000106500 [Trypanosoma vivax]
MTSRRVFVDLQQRGEKRNKIYCPEEGNDKNPYGIFQNGRDAFGSEEAEWGAEAQNWLDRADTHWGGTPFVCALGSGGRGGPPPRAKRRPLFVAVGKLLASSTARRAKRGNGRMVAGPGGKLGEGKESSRATFPINLACMGKFAVSVVVANGTFRRERAGSRERRSADGPTEGG